MSRVFADTAYFIALVSPPDRHHAAAQREAGVPFRQMVTTEWVLAELGAFLSRSIIRPRYLALVRSLQKHPAVAVISTRDITFEDGFQLFEQRADKEWSLTDCTSIIAMQRLHIVDVLTTDHHFTQAGFNVLLNL